MSIKFVEKFPTPVEYNSLSEAVGWGSKEKSVIEEAFKNTLYSLCVYEKEVLIGYGRIIGDKTIFLYFHDLKVLPKYQNQGIGSVILEKCCSETDMPIYLYVFTRNTRAISLYERFGFKVIEKVKDTRLIMQRDI